MPTKPFNTKSMETKNNNLNALLQQIELTISGTSDIGNTTDKLDSEFQSIISKTKSGLNSNDNTTTSDFISQFIGSSYRNNDANGTLTNKDDMFNNIFKSGLNDTEISSMISSAYRYRMVKLQDIEDLVHILPELQSAIDSCVDAITSGSDIVNGELVRTLDFGSNANDADVAKYQEAVEKMEKQYDLKNKIKGIIVKNTLMYGSYNAIIIPYSKLFNDFISYKNTSSFASNGQSFLSESSTISLYDKLHNNPNMYKAFTEDVSDVITHSVSSIKGAGIKDSTAKDYIKSDIDNILKRVSVNKSEVPFLLMDETPETIGYLYHKYSEQTIMESKDDTIKSNQSRSNTPDAINGKPYLWNDEGKIKDQSIIKDKPNVNSVIFDQSKQNTYDAGMKSLGSNITDDSGIYVTTKNGGLFKEDEIKDCYMKLVPPTKLLRIDIAGSTIGYIYAKTEDATILGGHLSARLSNAKFGKDNESSIFIDNIANEIINSFDKPFLQNNIKFKKIIADALNHYDLNTQKITFQFIPIEYVVEFNINRDENGYGRSMLDTSLFFAKLAAMFLMHKLFSAIRYGNDTINVFLRSSGLDKNTKNKVEEISRKRAQTRITVQDMFNCTGMLTKMSYGNEVYYPTGSSGEQPISSEVIEGRDVSMETEFMNWLRRTYITGTGVPSTIISYLGELDFSRQAEFANGKFIGLVCSLMIDLSSSITDLYKVLLRASCKDIIPDEVIDNFKFGFIAPKSANSETRARRIESFNIESEFYVNLLLGQNALDDPNNKESIKRFRLEYAKYQYPELDINNIEELYETKCKIGSVEDELKPDPDDGGENMADLEGALGGLQ